MAAAQWLLDGRSNANRNGDVALGREQVVRIFPSDTSAWRLIGALLAEQNRRRLDRKCFDVERFNEWTEAHAQAVPTDTVVNLAAWQNPTPSSHRPK